MITWMPNLDFDCYDPPCLQCLVSHYGRRRRRAVAQLQRALPVERRMGRELHEMFGFTLFNRTHCAGVAKRTGKP